MNEEIVKEEVVKEANGNEGNGGVRMSLARVLKEKERIARRLKDARDLFAACNVVSPDQKPQASVAEVCERMRRLQEQYLKIKKVISAANQGITDELTEMLVVRSEIDFYQKLDCKEEEFKEEYMAIGNHGNYEKRTIRVVYNTFLKDAARRDLIEKLQSRLDDLQDAVDSFNATHSVVMPE